MPSRRGDLPARPRRPWLLVADHALTDQRLIDGALGGSARADASLACLLERHRPWIARRCRGWLSNRHDADDAAQEVLIRVCAGLHGLEHRTRFKPWLARIVDNQCKTALGRRQRWVTVEHIEDLVDLLESPPDPGADPQVVASEQALVRSVLAQLPAPARQVLLLRFFQDFSLDQIARALDVSLSAAKMRLYRALERFAEAYRAAAV